MRKNLNKNIKNLYFTSAGYTFNKILDKRLKGESEDVFYYPVPYRQMKKKEDNLILDLPVRKKSMSQINKEIEGSNFKKLMKILETFLFLFVIFAWNASWIKEKRIEESYLYIKKKMKLS